MEQNNDRTIYELIEEWNELVAECEKGYSSSIYELDYDLQIRTLIQEKLKLINNDEILIDKINNIDNRLKEISTLRDLETENWWDKIILKFGGIDYVESIFNELKVKIRIT